MGDLVLSKEVGPREDPSNHQPLSSEHPSCPRSPGQYHRNIPHSREEGGAGGQLGVGDGYPGSHPQGLQVTGMCRATPEDGPPTLGAAPVPGAVRTTPNDTHKTTVGRGPHGSLDSDHDVAGSGADRVYMDTGQWPWTHNGQCGLGSNNVAVRAWASLDMGSMDKRVERARGGMGKCPCGGQRAHGLGRHRVMQSQGRTRRPDWAVAGGRGSATTALAQGPPGTRSFSAPCRPLSECAVVGARGPPPQQPRYLCSRWTSVDTMVSEMPGQASSAR